VSDPDQGSEADRLERISDEVNIRRSMTSNLLEANPAISQFAAYSTATQRLVFDGYSRDEINRQWPRPPSKSPSVRNVRLRLRKIAILSFHAQGSMCPQDGPPGRGSSRYGCPLGDPQRRSSGATRGDFDKMTELRTKLSAARAHKASLIELYREHVTGHGC